MDAKLYHLEGCPYCARVHEFISHRHLEDAIEYHEVSQEPESLRRLIQLTGRMQVPVLEVEGDAIIGSDVIIDWLDENAASLAGRHPPAQPHKPGTQSNIGR